MPARPLVGFIAASSRQERFERAFITGLRDQGFVRGRNIEVEFHWTSGTMEPVRCIVAGLIERRVAAIVTGGGNAALVARALTSSVPIVFATSTDPVAESLVASLARPGGNLTGLSLQSTELAPKLIEVLRDFLTAASADRIAALAVHHRLPVICEQAEHVRAGGLVSYAADHVDMHRRAAGYVARILRGASPAELPVEQPVRFELVINLRAARALGLTPPAALLDYADEVIE